MAETELETLRGLIRDVPDYPKKGVIFKDITTLLREGKWFKRAIDLLIDGCPREEFDQVIAVEARGFAIASPIAYCLEKGLVIARKPGKLPYRTEKISYELEYGSDSLEVHQGDIKPGSRVLMVDDLLATGGTSKAVIELVEKMGGKVVQCLYLIELTFLQGREKLKGYPLFSLIKF
ncbi:MAG: adenine phosphoribosyltransferase [Thermodesulfobacteriota bacterium]